MPDVTLWSTDPVMGGLLGGAAIGLFLLVFVKVTGKALGASTGYGNLCAAFSRLEFFRRPPYDEVFGWRSWFMIGIPLGGLVARLLSPGPIAAGFDMGALYESAMPDALIAKLAVVAGGGVLIGLGARMAGGCQSGHSISGLSLANPPSLVASIAFFAGGILGVQVLFRLAGAV